MALSTMYVTISLTRTHLVLSLLKTSDLRVHLDGTQASHLGMFKAEFSVLLTPNINPSHSLSVLVSGTTVPPIDQNKGLGILSDFSLSLTLSLPQSSLSINTACSSLIVCKIHHFHTTTQGQDINIPSLVNYFDVCIKTSFST